MRVGLVIYGSIETLTGGYLYDRRLLDHVVSRGDRAEVISLPRRNHYPRALCALTQPSTIPRRPAWRSKPSSGAAFPGSLPTRAVTIWPGIARKRSSRRRHERRGPCASSAGNVLPSKGLHVLIGALCRLPADSWRLQIVGSLTMDRPYVDRLRGLIARAGLATHVCLVGTVPNARIPEYLVRSHVFVVPSHYEALGIAYLEAMRFGLPVIATTAGGAHEIVEHGREGFLVAPGDADALTRHLRLLGTNRELLLQMGLAARRRAARHPSLERARISALPGPNPPA